MPRSSDDPLPPAARRTVQEEHWIVGISAAGFCALLAAQDPSLLMKVSCVSFWYAGISRAYVLARDGLRVLTDEVRQLCSLSWARLAALFNPFAGPTGLKWVRVDDAADGLPRGSHALESEALAAVLASKHSERLRLAVGEAAAATDDGMPLELSHEEWTQCDVHGLRGYHVITFMMPTTSDYTSFDQMVEPKDQMAESNDQMAVPRVRVSYMPRPGFTRRVLACCSSFWGNLCNLPYLVSEELVRCSVSVSKCYVETIGSLCSAYRKNPCMVCCMLIVLLPFVIPELSAAFGWGDADHGDSIGVPPPMPPAPPIAPGHRFAQAWWWGALLKLVYYLVMIVLVPATAIVLYYIVAHLLSPGKCCELCECLATAARSTIISTIRFPLLCCLHLCSVPPCRTLPALLCYSCCGFCLGCVGDSCCGLSEYVFGREIRVLEEEDDEDDEADPRRDFERVGGGVEGDAYVPLRPAESTMLEA